jgi:hypothetical protein
MLRRVVWQKFTDVSEVIAASITSAMSNPCKPTSQPKCLIAAAITSETSVIL